MLFFFANSRLRQRLNMTRSNIRDLTAEGTEPTLFQNFDNVNQSTPGREEN